LLLWSFRRDSDQSRARTKVAANGLGSVSFERVLQNVFWRLVTEGSVSYRRIKRSFGLVLATEGRLARPEGHGAAATIAGFAAH
jgi:hypothetical protein